MKAVVMETRKNEAAVLLKDGTFRIVKGKYTVGQVIELKGSARPVPRRWMAAAAALVVAAGIGSGLWIDGNYVAYGEVSLDINPSIVYTVNKRSRVLKVRAVGSEAEQVVESLEKDGIRFAEVSDAIEKTMGLLETEGYIDEEQEEYVLLNVSTDNARVKEAVTSAVQSGMERSLEHAHALSFRIEHSDRATARRAAQRNMSVGRYAAWEQAEDGTEPETYAEKPVREILDRPGDARNDQPSRTDLPGQLSGGVSGPENSAAPEEAEAAADGRADELEKTDAVSLPEPEKKPEGTPQPVQEAPLEEDKDFTGEKRSLENPGRKETGAVKEESTPETGAQGSPAAVRESAPPAEERKEKAGTPPAEEKDPEIGQDTEKRQEQDLPKAEAPEQRPGGKSPADTLGKDQMDRAGVTAPPEKEEGDKAVLPESGPEAGSAEKKAEEPAELQEKAIPEGKPEDGIQPGASLSLEKGQTEAMPIGRQPEPEASLLQTKTPASGEADQAPEKEKPDASENAEKAGTDAENPDLTARAAENPEDQDLVFDFGTRQVSVAPEAEHQKAEPGRALGRTEVEELAEIAEGILAQWKPEDSVKSLVREIRNAFSEEAGTLRGSEQKNREEEPDRTLDLDSQRENAEGMALPGMEGQERQETKFGAGETMQVPPQTGSSEMETGKAAAAEQIPGGEPDGERKRSGEYPSDTERSAPDRMNQNGQERPGASQEPGERMPGGDFHR